MKGSLNINYDAAIFHFASFPISFAMKSYVYFLTDQYLIIDYSKSKRTLSVFVRTVLCANNSLYKRTVSISVRTIIFSLSDGSVLIPAQSRPTIPGEVAPHQH